MYRLSGDWRSHVPKPRNQDCAAPRMRHPECAVHLIDTSSLICYDAGKRDPNTGTRLDDIVLEFTDADGEGSGLATLTTRYLHGPGIDQILASETTSGNVVTWALFGVSRSLMRTSVTPILHNQSTNRLRRNTSIPAWRIGVE
jgi:hypothetical protein